MEEKMSDEAEKALEDFRKKLIGLYVEVTSTKHPHFSETGVVKSIDYTNAGWGLLIEPEEGDSFYVFNGKEIKII